jgi:hypothetical protein
MLPLAECEGETRRQFLGFGFGRLLSCYYCYTRYYIYIVVIGWYRHNIYIGILCNVRYNMTEGDTTTIRVYEKDRKRISAHGFFGESFADVVERILDEYEMNKNPLEAAPALALA